MKMHFFKFICVLGVLSLFINCTQINKNHKHQIVNTMELNKILNPVVRQAIKAWQEGDSEKWLACFTQDPKLLDDGNQRDFINFSTHAIGTERFTTIDKVEDDGLSVFGQFHSDTWGDFKTYFKFSIDPEGKIYKLEIGQAHY